MKPSVPIAPLLKDAATAALLAAVLFMPILGIVLDRYTITFQLQRGAIAVAVVFAGRLLICLGREAGWFARLGTVAAPLRRQFDRAAALVSRRSRPFTAGLLAALVILPLLPFTSNYLMHVMTQTFIYVLLAMGLNIVVGLAGLLDLGFVAFYAVGAYTY
ncbi:MAG TPA: DUF3382 domain-containing protein, partial [bacterium]